MKETQDHNQKGHWVVRKRSEVNYPKTIMSIWSFKRKHAPDGRVTKYKARLCAHGGQQQWGVNYWETFSPVVNWMSVRLLLVVALIHDLPAQSIDFTLAFPQAKLNVPVYMEVPVGMDVQGAQPRTHVIKLKRSLYGLKQAGYNWFEKFQVGLDSQEEFQAV